MLTVEAYLTDGRFQSHISFFVYTFRKLVNFGKKLNTAFSDFHNIQSGRRGTVELSMDFCFHSNKCKMQIVCGNVVRS